MPFFCLFMFPATFLFLVAMIVGAESEFVFKLILINVAMMHLFFLRAFLAAKKEIKVRNHMRKAIRVYGY